MTQHDMEKLIEEKLSTLGASVDKLLAERDGAQGADKEWREGFDAKYAAQQTKIEQLEASLVEAKKRKIAGLEIGTNGEAEKFSTARALQIAIADAFPAKYAATGRGNPLQDKEWGYELEAMRQYTAQTGVDNQSGGWAIPQQVMTDSIIPDLKAEAILGTAGATVQGGMVGEVTWPKSRGGQAAYFTDFETFQTPTATKTEFGARKATPKMLASRTRMTWSMITQTSGLIERIVRDEIVKAITRRIDAASFSGAGAENQVRGLYTTSGTNAVDFNGAVFDQSNLTGTTTVPGLIDEMHWRILNAEYQLDRGAYIGQVNVGHTLARAKDSDGRRLFTDPEHRVGGLPSLFGRNAYWANIIAANTAAPATSTARLAYGDWSQLYILFWEGLAVRAEELSYGANDHDAVARSLTVFGTVFMDTFVREPKAFTLASNFTAAALA